MSESLAPSPKTVRPGRWQQLWQKLTENPVTVKELRSRMRGRRAFIVLTLYLVLMGFFVSLIYLTVTANDTSTSNARIAGQTIFFTMVSLEIFLAILLAPAFTAGAISGEKERQTYDLLRTTMLSPAAFVFGKLISALSYIFLLILSTLPLLSLAFVFGGIEVVEVVVSQILLLVAAVAYAMMGLYFSSAMRSTIGASVTTYALALFLTIGTPFIGGMFLSIIGAIFFYDSDILEVIFLYLGFLASVTNLPATLIISDVILRTENSMWGFTETFGGTRVWIFSPWYLSILFHGVMAWFFYWRSVVRVSSIANN